MNNLAFKELSKEDSGFGGCSLQKNISKEYLNFHLRFRKLLKNTRLGGGGMLNNTSKLEK